MRQSLRELRGPERKRRSREIIRRVIRGSVFKTARKVMVYMPLPVEVDTLGLIRKALAMGKEVYLPRVNSESKEISIFRIRNMKTDLCCGSYGIQEPRPVKFREGKPAALDLVIVPGLGFDRKGRRLGRGEGYFDRFLKRAKRAKKIGLAFREQVVKKIPAGARDVRMDSVVSG